MSQTVLLGDEIELIGGGTPKTSVPEYWDGDIPWLSVVDFGDDSRWVERAEKSITEDGLLNSSTKLLEPGDIIISARGTVGELAQLKVPMAFNQSCYGIRAKKNLDQNYLYYLLKYLIVDLQRQAHGGVFNTITRETFLHIKITPLSMTTQKEIADILSKLDEMIELNREMNNTLNQMGQALFSERFLNNPSSQSWSSSSIGDFVAHSKIGVNPSKDIEKLFSQYSIPAFDNSMTTEKTLGIEIKSNKYRVPDSSILVSKLNPANPRVWPVISAEENAVCSTEFQVVVPKKYYSFIYFLLTSRAYTQKMTMSAGGTSNSHRRINPKDIFSFSFSRPDGITLEEYETATMPLLTKIFANRSQSRTLATLRDTILPRLISGKVKI